MICQVHDIADTAAKAQAGSMPTFTPTRWLFTLCETVGSSTGWRVFRRSAAAAALHTLQ